MSRGKPKPSLHDLSRAEPTSEEKETVHTAFKEGSPIVTAILGQALVEHELEVLLRESFKRRDSSTWGRLTNENNGPLSTFSAKIICGHALSLYDDTVMKNLNAIRDVRNVFAHSKKLIKFSEPEITDRFHKIVLPRAKTTNYYKDMAHIKGKETASREDYIILCQAHWIVLLRRAVRRVKATKRNYERKLARAANRNPIYPYLFPGGLAGSGGNSLRWLSGGHTYYPNPLVGGTVLPPHLLLELTDPDSDSVELPEAVSDRLLSVTPKPGEER